jgi:hypothetical protein
MTRPPPLGQGGSRYRTAEALQQERKEGQWKCGAGVTVRRRAEPQARERGHMAAGGVAVPHLSQEERHGGDRREHAVAPPGITDRDEGGVDTHPDRRGAEDPNIRQPP